MRDDETPEPRPQKAERLNTKVNACGSGADARREEVRVARPPTRDSRGREWSGYSGRPLCQRSALTDRTAGLFAIRVRWMLNC